MKTEDFERLKQICQKEGFEVKSYSACESVVVGLRDEWKGIKFAECAKQGIGSFTKGKIYRMFGYIDSEKVFLDDEGERNGYYPSNKVYFKPSTETAYVEQLKRMAKEKFGDIKEGDRFDRKTISDNFYPRFCDIGIYNDVAEFGFKYKNDSDILEFSGCTIYKEGKWAERVKERVKVKLSDYMVYRDLDDLDVEFKISPRITKDKGKEIAEYLTKQLENYLNNDPNQSNNI